MRGLFDKNSVPPPPAGRGPMDVPKPAGVAPSETARLPEPRGLPTDEEVTVSAAFPLLPDRDALTTAPAAEDPIAHLFDADPPRPSRAGDAEPPLAEAASSKAAEEAAETVVLDAGAQDSNPPDESAVDAVKAATEESFASLFTSEPPTEPRHVAKVELTRATPGSAQEIAAADFSRDPRSEESIRPRSEREPSASNASPVDDAMAPASSGLFPNSEPGLQEVVFDPDQSVARHLGEVAIDSELGPTAQSEALSDLPLPQVPAPPSLDDGVSDKPPTRSMRPALIVIAVLMVSGGAVTLGSLGVLEEEPAEYRREAAEARKSREAPPPTAAPTAPAKPSGSIADPPAAPAAQPAPAETVPASAEVAEAPVAVAVVPDVAVPAEAVVASAPAKPEAPVAEEPAQRVVISDDPVAAGDSLFRGGDLDAALVQYEAGLRADSRDHHAMEGLARIHLARGNAAEALPFAEQMVKRRPKRAAYRVLHGQALLGVGDRAGARRAFQEALTLEPGNSEARRLLGS